MSTARIALLDLGPSRPELHEPIGVETLAAAHERVPGVIADVFSLTFVPDHERRLLATEYDLVGFAGKLGTWSRLKRLADALRRQPTPPRIVVGDLLGTYAWREVLEAIPGAICVVGEGEEAWEGLVRAVREPGFDAAIANVPNLIYREGGKVTKTRRGAVDVTKRPLPVRSFLGDAVTRRAQVQIEASRGCPWSRCSFCSIPNLNGVTWRPVDLDAVLEQIVEVSEAGARSVYFTDSDFLGTSMERAHRFADLLLEAKGARLVHPEVNFYLNLQATGIVGGSGNTREECEAMLVHLREAGLREVFVGLESGAREQVRRYAKASTPARNHGAVATLHRLGLQADVGFIMFDPDVTPAEILFNLDFLDAAGLGRHPSRFTKALRIQPDTGFADTHFDGPRPALNVNNLSFPYRFRDPTTDGLYREFRRWELEHLEYETLVQGASKGEVSSEAARVEIRDYLGSLRELDLRFLREAAAACTAGEVGSAAFVAVRNELRHEMAARIARRPADVDAHAERLGLSSLAALDSTAYAERFRTLNVYEDPVYADLRELAPV